MLIVHRSQVYWTIIASDQVGRQRRVDTKRERERDVSQQSSSSSSNCLCMHINYTETVNNLPKQTEGSWLRGYLPSRISQFSLSQFRFCDQISSQGLLQTILSCRNQLLLAISEFYYSIRLMVFIPDLNFKFFTVSQSISLL